MGGGGGAMATRAITVTVTTPEAVATLGRTLGGKRIVRGGGRRGSMTTATICCSHNSIFLQICIIAVNIISANYFFICRKSCSSTPNWEGGGGVAVIVVIVVIVVVGVVVVVVVVNVVVVVVVVVNVAVVVVAVVVVVVVNVVAVVVLVLLLHLFLLLPAVGYRGRRNERPLRWEPSAINYVLFVSLEHDRLDVRMLRLDLDSSCGSKNRRGP